MSEQGLTVPPEQDVHKLIARVSDKKLTFGQRLDSVGKVMAATAKKMMAALPKHITPDRMMRVALNAIRKNPKLLDCDPASLFACITEAATYGWEIGGTLGHAYIVPFGRECTLIPGYKGLLDLCRRSGQVSTVQLEVVHEGDKFDYELGDDPHIRHKPDDKNSERAKKPITHAYAVVRLRDGGVQRSVWSQQAIDAHKEKYSKGWKFSESGPPASGGGKKDSPWHTAWPTMAKKTVIRDMINRGLVPVSAEYRDIVERGVKYDDDGALDLDAIDIVPIDSDADLPGIEQGESDRPPMTTDPDPLLIDDARQAFSAAVEANSVQLVSKAEEDYRVKAHDEPTREAISGLANDARQRVSAQPKGKRQGELVK